MTHYFTDNRNLTSNRKEHSFRFLGDLYHFVTDRGVFSFTQVDYGSQVLLETCVDQVKGTILDLGCGYGVLGIILGRHTKTHVDMVDVNARAIELCQINIEQNGVDACAFVSDGFSQIDRVYDTIVTNPPIRTGKKVIYKMFEDSFQHLVDKGSLWVVIRKQQGAQSAVAKLEEIFGNCTIVNRDAGYWILKSEKLTESNI